MRALLIVGAIGALWALWALISGSQLFEIETIDVRGVAALSSDAVIQRAAVPDGETLLRLDKDAVTDRLLADPWIADARVSRRIPSTLRISVEERVPVAVVDTGVTFWFVDGNGRVLSESLPDSATVLPVIRDLPDFAAEPGVVSESKILRNALRVLAGLGDDLLASVRTVSAPSANETALLTASSVEIMIGEATLLDEKSILVADILREQGDQVVFIDVRSVERPISRGLNP
jgi:cell division protein FtsQ